MDYEQSSDSGLRKTKTKTKKFVKKAFTEMQQRCFNHRFAALAGRNPLNDRGFPEI
jgi:hypothetical protein